MYLGVEQAVTASEEAELPSRDVPRGLFLALAMLTLTAVGVVVFAPGAGNVSSVAAAGDPLLAALDSATSEQGWLVTLIGAGAIFGLLASFFSLSYSASRQLFDLSRTGFFPSSFAKVTTRGTPVAAFLLVAAVGFGISLFPPEKVLLSVVLLFTSTYVLTTLSFLRLRKTLADVPRGYRAKGGIATGAVTLLLSGLIFYACFSTDLVTLAVIALVFAFVLFYRRMSARAVTA
ncbi:ethanolamine permease [compost metagenome]